MNLYCAHPAINADIERLLPIGKLLRDPANQEISIHGGGQVYVDAGRGMRNTGLRVPEMALRAVIRLLTAASGGYLDAKAPFTNLQLANGGRFHGALPPVADEPQISIRLHSGMGRPATDFMTTDELARIRTAIADRKSIIVGGATSSGKSTLLNSLLDFIDDDLQLVLIEDVYELKPAPHKNVIRRLASGHADLKRQVFESLRNRPDWILIGETRDRSAWDLMDASRTGHPILSTVHASSAEGVITRLMSLAGCDREFVREAIDLVLFVQRMPNGKRTVSQIQEMEK
jgi:pilus assembly protein CpaF